jgi:hypothetical protein
MFFMEVCEPREKSYYGRYDRRLGHEEVEKVENRKSRGSAQKAIRQTTLSVHQVVSPHRAALPRLFDPAVLRSTLSALPNISYAPRRHTSNCCLTAELPALCALISSTLRFRSGARALNVSPWVAE